MHRCDPNDRYIYLWYIYVKFSLDKVVDPHLQ